MKTYAEYEQTSFVNHIDEANGRIRQLEAKQGKPLSPFESNVEAANRRIWELENAAPKAPAAPPATAAGGKKEVATRQEVPARRGFSAKESIIGFHRTGKATGLCKAVGAAVEREQGDK